MKNENAYDVQGKLFIYHFKNQQFRSFFSFQKGHPHILKVIRKIEMLYLVGKRDESSLFSSLTMQHSTLYSFNWCRLLRQHVVYRMSTCTLYRVWRLMITMYVSKVISQLGLYIRRTINVHLVLTLRMWPCRQPTTYKLHTKQTCPSSHVEPGTEKYFDIGRCWRSCRKTEFNQIFDILCQHQNPSYDLSFTKNTWIFKKVGKNLHW